MAEALPPSADAGRVRIGVILTLGQGALRGAVVALTVVLAHRFPERTFGDFVYLMALLNLLTIVADGGFSRLLIRDVARARGRGLGFVRSVAALRLAWTTLLILVSVLVLLVSETTDASLVALLALALLFEAFAAGLEAAGIGAERPWRVVTGQLISAGVLAIGIVALLVTARPSLATAFLMIALAAGAKAAWQAWRWAGILRGGRVWPDRQTIAGWTKQTVPFLVLALLGAIYYRIDIVILYGVAGAKETASYGAAYRVVDAALLIGGVIAATVSAHVSRLHVERPERVWPEWRRYALKILVVSAGPLLLVTIFSEPICALVFGEAYRNTAGSDLRILAPGIVFMLLQLLNAAVLFTSDAQRFIVRLSFLHVLMNITLTYLLVVSYGSTGAALATSASEVITFVLFATMVWWLFGRGRPERGALPQAGA